MEAFRLPVLVRYDWPTVGLSTPILTVGEKLGFLGAGGMICFVLEHDNVRFRNQS
jgi:hypothetical protein